MATSLREYSDLLELAGVEEVLLDSEDDTDELSLLVAETVSDVASDEDLESLDALESEEELSLLLLSTGGLGRP